MYLSVRTTCTNVKATKYKQTHYWVVEDEESDKMIWLIVLSINHSFKSVLACEMLSVKDSVEVLQHFYNKNVMEKMIYVTDLEAPFQL